MRLGCSLLSDVCRHALVWCKICAMPILARSVACLFSLTKYGGFRLLQGSPVAIKVFTHREFSMDMVQNVAKETALSSKFHHPNIVALKHCFYSNGEKRNELYLNLVLEYVPETVHRMTRNFQKRKKMIPILCVKLQVYQLCRSLAYIHSLGICHRDIKPQNLLVNPETWVLKLCDFGSAKKLVSGEPNVSYICSRYYRAPELIFGATEYTTAIGMCGRVKQDYNIC